MKLLARQVNNSLDGRCMHKYSLSVPISFSSSASLKNLKWEGIHQSLALPEKTSRHCQQNPFCFALLKKSHPYAFGFASALTFVTSYTVCTLLTPISMTELMCTCPPHPQPGLAFWLCALLHSLSAVSGKVTLISPDEHDSPLLPLCAVGKCALLCL